ncbi:DUF6037 family protein [Bifidobacterium choerinum]|uniref:Uncharacterized protein n=1 Tax=Bifidobacterium choerinum TaxID=35760 RepID=A0A2D3D688_9BIFI|nr:DUF6037 family protein [Bifidobacterium choerinum]ATU20574.1 hypothetical protein BcFMB_06205 [Bifidobacterium choerinum]
MQLHTLTETARAILAQHGETRFFWRYQDQYVPTAQFEVLFTATLANDGSIGDAELFICQCGGINNPWNHSFSLLMRNGTYQCSARLEGKDYYTLINILHIGRRRQGTDPWSPAIFLGDVDGSSAHVRNNWARHRIRTINDLPATYRSNIEESNKIYYICAREISPNGPTEANQEKTRRLIGPMWAQQCKKLRKSTCWTDQPPRDKDGHPIPVRLPKDTDAMNNFH